MDEIVCLQYVQAIVAAANNKNEFRFSIPVLKSDLGAEAIKAERQQFARCAFFHHLFYIIVVRLLTEWRIRIIFCSRHRARKLAEY